MSAKKTFSFCYSGNVEDQVEVVSLRKCVSK